MKRVVISTTYDINNYTTTMVSDDEFARLEALRGDAQWGETADIGGGFYETYHGPAPAQDGHS